MVARKPQKKILFLKNLAILIKKKVHSLISLNDAIKYIYIGVSVRRAASVQG